MNIKEIRQLVKLMIDNDLSELDVAEGDARVHLKRGMQVAAAPGPVRAPAGEPVGAAVAPAGGELEAEEAAERLLEIRSPMVGTFYTAPSPDSDAYVTVGSEVSEESVVCIVEAMKVMNEIKAECSGTIVDICVKNEQPVEYAQVLCHVRPS